MNPLPEIFALAAMFLTGTLFGGGIAFLYLSTKIKFDDDMPSAASSEGEKK